MHSEVPIGWSSYGSAIFVRRLNMGLMHPPVHMILNCLDMSGSLISLMEGVSERMDLDRLIPKKQKDTNSRVETFFLSGVDR